MRFGYDLNTGENSRAFDRRSHSCPKNWKASHGCPEVAPPVQQKPMRHDGEWYTTAIVPRIPSATGLPSYALLDQLLPPKSSGIYYSCDEFPAAPC